MQRSTNLIIPREFFSLKSIWTLIFWIFWLFVNSLTLMHQGGRSAVRKRPAVNRSHEPTLGAKPLGKLQFIGKDIMTEMRSLEKQR
jgi:hypothetical protein